MSFVRTYPGSPQELFTYLCKLADGRAHVKSIRLDPSTNHLEVSLDWVAHMTGAPDVYLPIKTANVSAVQMLVDKFLAGGVATAGDAAELWAALGE